MEYQDEKLQPSNYAIIRWFSFDQFVPERAVTSYWVSPKVFFCIRFVVALYSTIVIWANIGFTASTGDFKEFFAFFTNLTFVGLHAYLITAVVHHAQYLLRSKNPDSFLEQPTFLNYLYVYLYSTVVTFNIVTPVVYWSILAESLGPLTTIRAWINDSVHGASFFMMLIDVIFNRMKLPIRMILFPFATIILYMLMAFIVYACNHYWVYPFLDWTQGPRAAIWYFAVGIIAIVAYFIQVFIHWLRDFVARKIGRASLPQAQAQEIKSMTKIEASETNV